MPKTYCPECEAVISLDNPQGEPPSAVASAAWNWRSSRSTASRWTTPWIAIWRMTGRRS